MKETPRHKKAFEYYVGLWDSRSLAKVSRKFNVSVQSLVKWSKAFNWKERATKRDDKNATKLANKTDKTILKTKTDFIVEAQESLLLLRGTLAILAEKIRDKTIKADSAKDLAALLKVQELLIKLIQVLNGEVDSRAGTVINVNLLPVDPSPRVKPVESKELENG